MTGINVAIAGVGGCASSLLQLVQLAHEQDVPLPGLSHPDVGGYTVADLRFVTAFDVDVDKVGLDLAEAVVLRSVRAKRYVDLKPESVVVQPGPLLDGLKGRLGQIVEAHPDSRGMGRAAIADALRETRPDVLLCLLPTGSRRAVEEYARAAIDAGVAFVNATPEPVVLSPTLVRRFQSSGVPVLGDDLRSHLGATALHTALIELFASRGIDVLDTYQLNIGGNADFYNLADPLRSASKQRSKRRALTAAGIPADDIAAGPNGFVRFLGDTKTCFIRIDGCSVLGSDIQVELRLNVEDSPNAAGVLVNAVRAAMIARDRGLSGVIDEVCAFLFKGARCGASESVALRHFNAFVRPVSGS